MMKKCLEWKGTATVSGVLMAALAMPVTQAHADSKVEEILDRGELRVGVLGGFRPWSFRDSDGNLQGIEIDLAQSVADALGVDLEPVVVTSSNRMRYLQQGRIDVIIGGMYDTAERREEVGMIEPSYWASGPTLMAQEGVIDDWSDIDGRPVCAIQGVYYNSQVQREFGAEIVAFTGNTEAKQALRDGRCIAWVYDDAVVMADLQSGDWDGYEMAVPALYHNPWAAAVALDEVDSAWGAMMTGKAYRWHASGKLVELEEKWGIEPSAWMADQHEKHRWDDSYLTQ